MNETEIDRLNREAEELERQAERMHGCSWVGDEPPWADLIRTANDKRQLAFYLKLSQRQAKEKSPND